MDNPETHTRLDTRHRMNTSNTKSTQKNKKLSKDPLTTRRWIKLLFLSI